MAGALDFLDEQIQALGGPVGGAGGVAGEDLSFPAGEGQPKAAHLADGVQPAAFDRLVDLAARRHASSRPDRCRSTDSLASHAPRTHVSGSPTQKPEEHAIDARAIEALGA